MSQMAGVADLLARSDRSFIRTQHRNRTMQLWMLGVTVPIYLFGLCMGAVALISAWRGSDWWPVWLAVAQSMPVATGITQVALWTDTRALLFAPVARLREAIRSGDASFAPLAAPTRPTLPTPSALAAGQIGPLRRRNSAGMIAWLVGGAAILLLLLAIGVPLALTGGLAQLAASFAATCLPPAVVLLVLAWRYARPLYIRVDDQSLRWRSPAGRSYRLFWRDANSFLALTYLTLTYPRVWRFGNDTVYGLAAENSGLAWRADLRAPAQDARPSPSAALLHLIAERTGLPLREVSVEAKRIAATARPVSHTNAAGTMEGEVARSPELGADTPGHRLRMLGLALSPFLLLAAISLVAMLVQAPFYEHLYAQSHSHQPLYADPLTSADGDWITTSFASFANDAYHFSGSETVEDVMYIPAPRHVDYALYEVTGRTGVGFDLSGEGLAIAANDRAVPMLAFRVAPAGSWWLERTSSTQRFDFKSNTIRLKDTDTIHEGFGVANRIAALIRGSNVIFFINGHYATGYQNDALAGGAGWTVPRPRF